MSSGNNQSLTHISENSGQKNLEENENKSNKNIDKIIKREVWIVAIIILIIQIILIVLIGLYYDPEKSYEDFFGTGTFDEKAYMNYKDIAIMIFVGFGFLYTYLHTHSLTSVTINGLVGILSFEIALITNPYWHDVFNKKFKGTKTFPRRGINIESITGSLVTAGSILVSLGAVIGRLSVIQYVVLALVGTIFVSLNNQLCEFKLKALDTGGSIYIHTFGAIFGCSTSLGLTIFTNEAFNICKHKKNRSSRISNLTAFIGSIFLWIYWPSFNVGLIHEQLGNPEKANPNSYANRGIINTIMSLAGSLVGSFLTSYLLYEGKFDTEQVLNSSFAGGVIIGGCCYVCGYFWAALLIGFLGGAISSLCFSKLKPLTQNLGLADTAGILNIHGIPGILGGFLTAIFIATMKTGENKMWKSKENAFNAYNVGIDKGDNWSRSKNKQAAIQVASIFITIGIAIISGILNGFLLRGIKLRPNEDYFEDFHHFELEESKKEK